MAGYYDDSGQMIGTNARRENDDLATTASPSPSLLPTPAPQRDGTTLSSRQLSGFESPEELIAKRQQQIAQREQTWLAYRREHRRRTLLIACGTAILLAVLCLAFGLGGRAGFIGPLGGALAALVYGRRIDHLWAALVFLPLCIMTFPVFWFGLQILCIGMVVAICGQLDRDRRNQRMITTMNHREQAPSEDEPLS